MRETIMKKDISSELVSIMDEMIEQGYIKKTGITFTMLKGIVKDNAYGPFYFDYKNVVFLIDMEPYCDLVCSAPRYDISIIYPKKII